jgi:hypothetical protein
MNNPYSDSADSLEDEVLPEYEFDYSRAKQNRFASETGEPAIATTSDCLLRRVLNVCFTVVVGLVAGKPRLW